MCAMRVNCHCCGGKFSWKFSTRKNKRTNLCAAKHGTERKDENFAFLHSFKVIDRFAAIAIGNFHLDKRVRDFLTTIFLDNTCRDYLHNCNNNNSSRTLCRASSWCAHQAISEERKNITPFIIRHCVVCLCLHSTRSSVVYDDSSSNIGNTIEFGGKFSMGSMSPVQSCDSFTINFIFYCKMVANQERSNAACAVNLTPLHLRQSSLIALWTNT